MSFKNIQQLENKLKEIEKKYKEAERMEEFELALKEYHGDDEIISFKKYKEILSKEKKEINVYSKIQNLDKIIDGFRGGDLVVVSGPTSQGKTTLCQTFTKNFSDQNINPLWFSYEVSGRDFINKFGEDIPVGFIPKKLIDNRLIWIERKIVESIVKYGTKAVFIDHLHYLIDMSKIRNSSLEIGAIVRKIKSMAVKYRIIMFLIAHTTKIKFDDRVGIEDIRDTSFIGQESDFVLMVWRDREKQSKFDARRNGIRYNNRAILSVEKNRRTGRLGIVKLIYKNNLFYEEYEI